jgi:hypothetical protein
MVQSTCSSLCKTLEDPPGLPDPATQLLPILTCSTALLGLALRTLKGRPLLAVQKMWAACSAHPAAAAPPALWPAERSVWCLAAAGPPLHACTPSLQISITSADRCAEQLYAMFTMTCIGSAQHIMQGRTGLQAPMQRMRMVTCNRKQLYCTRHHAQPQLTRTEFSAIQKSASCGPTCAGAEQTRGNATTHQGTPPPRPT